MIGGKRCSANRFLIIQWQTCGSIGIIQLCVWDIFRRSRNPCRWCGQKSITVIIGIYPWAWGWVDNFFIMTCACWKTYGTCGGIQICVCGVFWRGGEPPCREGRLNSITIIINIRNWAWVIVNRIIITYCASWRLWHIHNRLQILISNWHDIRCIRITWRRQMSVKKSIYVW